jgi:hypothetical protein
VATDSNFPDTPDHRYNSGDALTFFGVYKDNVSDVAYLLCIIPLKQLSGFKWWRTSLYVILSYLAALAILFAVMLAAVEIQILLESL